MTHGLIEICCLVALVVVVYFIICYMAKLMFKDSDNPYLFSKSRISPPLQFVWLIQHCGNYQKGSLTNIFTTVAVLDLSLNPTSREKEWKDLVDSKRVRAWDDRFDKLTYTSMEVENV